MKKYKRTLSLQEWLNISGQSLLITGIVAYLFYQSVGGLVLYPVCYVLRYRKYRKQLARDRKQMLEEQFIHAMRILNSALQAGLSMENALREVQKEIRLMYGEDGEFYQRLKDMNQSIGFNIPVEGLFQEFAFALEVEDAISFSEVFSYGKRYGGNWKRIIDTTVQRMNDKYEAQKEIEVMVAEKQMEQQVMNLMPLGMLAFLLLSANDYMAVLYHNWLGILCMSICLIVYLLALALSERILKIQV